MREDELREELESHLAMRAEANQCGGMTPEEARAAARRQFGSLALTAEKTRAVHVNRWLETLMQDVRYALRGFRRAPVFTAVAVISLALGIGANTAVFTLADQVLLRMLPVRNPRELVRFEAPGAQVRLQRDYPNTVSYPLFVDIRRNNDVFSGVIVQFGAIANAGIQGRVERVRCDLVSGNYYDVLGVRPAAGRLLTSGDDRTLGAHPVAVLSYDFWKARFGGDPAVIGRTITLNQTAMTVVGVSQAGFRGLVTDVPPEITVPLMMKPQVVRLWSLTDPRHQWLHMFARLKPGVSIAQAEAAVNVLYRAHASTDLRGYSAAQRLLVGHRLNVVPALRGLSGLRSRFEVPLKVLLALVGFVLLMTCANLAGLLSARATARRAEFAVRLAVGASRTRLIRQLMVESFLLALAGGVSGLLLAWATARGLIAMLPVEEHGQALFAVPDARVIAFTLAACTAATVLFGLAPAIQATRPALQPGRFRKALIAVQVAVALVLTISAGLFVRTLHNLQTIHPGFARERLILFSLDPTLNGYDQTRVRTLYDRVEERLKTIPGVTRVALVGFGTVNSAEARNVIRFEGSEHGGQGVEVHEAYIGPGALAALGVPLDAGREFLPSDHLSTRTVAIVTRSLARKYLGAGAVGKHIGFALSPKPPGIEIVGVAGDILPENPRDRITGTVFLPAGRALAGIPATFHVRTALRPEALFEAIRREVRAIDPAVPVTGLKTMEAHLEEALFTERMVALLSVSFGLLAVLLAAIGIYGVIAFSVARRTKEFGIRIAFGAQGYQLAALVMREVVVMLGVGVVAGGLLAAVAARFVRALLYGVEPFDLPGVAAAALLLIAAGCCAGLVPARRAALADVAGSLRCE